MPDAARKGGVFVCRGKRNSGLADRREKPEDDRSETLLNRKKETAMQIIQKAMQYYIDKIQNKRA